MNQTLLVTLASAAVALAPGAFAQTAAAPAAATAAAAPAAADAVATVQKVCLPVLRGQPLKPAAQAAGFKLQGGGWVMPIAGKDEIDLVPPDGVNPHVCSASITARPGEGAAMRAALGAWAAAQSPPLAPAGVDQNAPGAPGWVTSTWSGKAASGAESVVLTQPQAAATSGGAATDQPGGAAEQTTLLVSLSPA